MVLLIKLLLLLLLLPSHTTTHNNDSLIPSHPQIIRALLLFSCPKGMGPPERIFR